MAQQQAGRSGLGLVTLHYFMGDADSSILKLTVNFPPPVREIWLVAYPERRQASTAVVALKFIANAISKACQSDLRKAITSSCCFQGFLSCSF